MHGECIMRFESSALVLDIPAYTRTSLISNKLDPAAEFKGLKNNN